MLKSVGPICEYMLYSWLAYVSELKDLLHASIRGLKKLLNSDSGVEILQRSAMNLGTAPQSYFCRSSSIVVVWCCPVRSNSEMWVVTLVTSFRC